MRISKSYTENLIKPIVAASLSNNWDEAVTEWDIEDCEEDEHAETNCMCGHEGIRYLFRIRNRFNGNTFFPIGSECIKKFGRADLSAEVDVQERMFKLYDALIKGRRIQLNSEFFSRKLLMYFLDQDAFAPNRYNGNDGANDYQFMLNMFNSRREASSAQDSKINAIIAFSIKPFLAKRLSNKKRQGERLPR